MQHKTFITFLIINTVHSQDNNNGLLAIHPEHLLWNIEKDLP